MMVDDEDVIKSVRRVFEILEWFEKGIAGASASIIARELGYPMSSANALLKSMSDLGYLRYDPLRREYGPTLMLARRSAWLDRHWTRHGRLRALARELQQDTDEMVSVSCRNDLEMTFIDFDDPKRIARSEPGNPIPLFRSVVGAAALSTLSDQHVDDLVNRHNRRTHRHHLKVDPAAVFARVRQVRRQGCGAGYGLVEHEMGAVAWLLPSVAAGPPVVIAVAGPSDRIRTAEKAIIDRGNEVMQRYCAMN